MIERTFIQQGLRNMELEEFLKKELEKAGFTKSEIVKTPLVTRIVVNVTKPGLAIGKSGQNIRSLTNEIGRRFGIDNPQLEIKEITKPELDAQSMADRIKAMIERGFSWRSVVYRVMRDIVEAKAQGVEIILSGKLAGKGGRKRKQRIAQGYMKKAGDQVKFVDYAKAAAYPKVGAIGIKVSIVRPETIFPDKVHVRDLVFKEEAGEETVEGKAVEAVEAGKEVKATAASSPEKKAEAKKGEKGAKEAEKGKEKQEKPGKEAKKGVKAGEKAKEKGAKEEGKPEGKAAEAKGKEVKVEAKKEGKEEAKEVKVKEEKKGEEKDAAKEAKEGKKEEKKTDKPEEKPGAGKKE